MKVSRQVYYRRSAAIGICALAALMLGLTSSISKARSSSGGDSGQAVTLADLTQKGPQLASDFTGDPTQHEQLANFAWREFIALNTPAGSLPANRGIPDATKSFVTSGNPDFYSSGKVSGQLGTNLLVWETYAHRSELFPASSPQTSPFAKAPSYSFTNTPTFGSGVLQLYNNLDEASQIGQNIIFFPKNPPTPSSNPFEDDQLLFEAKVNELEYNYGQGTSENPFTLPTNSVEVKAAWRLITDDMDSSRYHTADAVYYTEEGGTLLANNATFGLVGLHIIHKTENYPTFIFATFEQIDALELPNGDPTGLYYITDYTTLCYDPGQLPGPKNDNDPQVDCTKGGAPVAIINNGSGQLAQHTLPAPSANLHAASGLPAGHAGPITVTQPPTITQPVKSVNANVLNLMNSSSDFNGSVWKYYKLKGVQAIPTNEQAYTQAPSPDTLDYYLANITIESSQPGVQLFKGGVVGPNDADLPANTDFINNRNTDGYVPYHGHAPVNASNVTLPSANLPSLYDGKVTAPAGSKVIMGGCMGCHGQAQQGGVDFSFLFFSKGAGFEADATGQLSNEFLLTRALSYQAKPKKP